MHVTDAAKCSLTNTTGTNILSTLDAWTKETGSTLATCVTAPSRNVTGCAFISYTCTRNTDLISAVSVASGFPSPRV